MPRTLRTIVLALVVTLGSASAAQAVMSGVPEFTLATHTRAQAGAGNAVALTMHWLPTTFLDEGSGNNKQQVTITDLAGGSPQTYSASSPTANSLGPIFVSDGHTYSIRVSACQNAGSCVANSINTLETTETTIIDATPPAGTVAVNGGAFATNNRAVQLTLAAADPLIGGIAGTSSGITQFAVDNDGDGVFPCSFLLGGDTSGCAQDFGSGGTATLTAGDGLKTVGVQFGDGAREPVAPCPPNIFCAVLLGQPILGNASAAVTDTILLDTVKPVARLAQDAVTVERGDSATFDAASSTDGGPATPSGVDPAATSWDFNDGTPPATGNRVTHTFSTVGTLVGTLRVRDRAGNVSDARNFTVTVTPQPGETVDGSGSVAGISGSAAFAISRVSVKARYVTSRLRGSITITGAAAQPGTLRTSIRRPGRAKAVGVTRGPVRATTFTRTIPLPPTLLPGSYRLSLVGPGGTLTTTLTLTAPRVGVASGARVRLSGHPTARFTFAARPARALRGKMTVAWTQGGRTLGVVKVGAGRTVSAALPAGASLRAGRLTATLRAGGTPVARATARVR